MSDFTKIKRNWKYGTVEHYDIKALIDIIEKQRGALKFYGDKENYEPRWDEDNEYQFLPIIEDEGETARDILELTEQ